MATDVGMYAVPPEEQKSFRPGSTFASFPRMLASDFFCSCSTFEAIAFAICAFMRFSASARVSSFRWYGARGFNPASATSRPMKGSRTTSEAAGSPLEVGLEVGGGSLGSLLTAPKSTYYMRRENWF